MLEYMTSGESHGPSILSTITGFPAGMTVDIDKINAELAGRQAGYGRGKRMGVEKDQVKVLAGISKGKTTGSPITFEIKNKLRTIESSDKDTKSGRKPVTIPRPGHADLPGYLKYGFDDIRNVIERASARETAARVAAGSLFKQFLQMFGITIRGYVRQIGSISIDQDNSDMKNLSNSLLRCPDPSAEKRMIELLDEIVKKGDTLGGVFTVTADNVPCGLGSYVSYKTRIEGKLCAALMSIPSAKGVEVGDGFANAAKPGSQVHDEIIVGAGGKIERTSNNAGGIEGGITNGQQIVLNCAVKPISTLRSPLKTVDLKTKEPVISRYERSDVCIVPSAALIGETMTAFVLCREFLEKFGSDNVEDIKFNYNNYLKRISNLI